MQRAQEDQDPSVKSNETGTENQFFKGEVNEENRISEPDREEEVPKLDSIERGYNRKEEAESKSKKKKEQYENNEILVEQEKKIVGEKKEKHVEENSTNSPPRQGSQNDEQKVDFKRSKEKLSEGGSSEKNLKSETRNAPENPPMNIGKNSEKELSKQIESNNTEAKPHQHNDTGILNREVGNENHSTKRSSDSSSINRESPDVNGENVNNSNKAANNVGPSVLSKPNFKKKTKQEGGGSGNYSVQDPSHIEQKGFNH